MDVITKPLARLVDWCVSIVGAEDVLEVFHALVLITDSSLIFL
jgi:hypothetical protein